MGGSTTVAEKMGVRTGQRAYLEGAPSDVVDAMRLPALDVAAELTGAFDHLHLFAVTQGELRARFAVLRDHVAPRGRLWVSWPKGRRLGSDLTMRSVIAIGYDLGMVESTCLRVDETWAALRFTHPKPGRTYRNSYGTLPDQRR